MSFLSCEEMLAAARSQKITLAEAVLRSDLDESRLTEEQSRAAMHHLWQVMQATSREYDPAQRSAVYLCISIIRILFYFTNSAIAPDSVSYVLSTIGK